MQQAARGMPAVAASENVGRVRIMENGRHPTSNGFVYIRDGVKHRDKGPAEVWRNGYEAWWRMGKKHRKGGPAVTYPNGREEYWEEGRLIKVVDPNVPAPGTKVNLRKSGHRRLRKGN